MKRIVIFFLPIFYLLFSSCEKEELPITPHDPGDIITATVNMDASYKWQIYFDLKTNSIVSQNLKSDWDLGFEASTAGFHVVLNTSKGMYAWNTGDTNFATISDTLGFSFHKKWDETSGNLDSTAIGDWRNTGNVFIIDRGYNELGLHQGFRKIIFQSVDTMNYIIQFANMDGSDEAIYQITKNDNYNFTFFSFNNLGETKIIEPPKSDWDICFTQFTYIFYDEIPITPYLVTGCLLNRYNTQAKMDSAIDFNDIDYDYAVSKTLSILINEIGYGWKGFNGVSYVTYPEMNYIILDSEGEYFKLHFIDFYNSLGVKGNPTFEFQRL